MQAGVGLWRWEPATQRLHADAALLGEPAARDPAAGPVDDLFPHVHPDDTGRLRAALRQALADAGAGQSATSHGGVDIEVRISGGENGEAWLALRGGVARDAEGRPVALCGVGVDVTARKLAEQSVIQAKEGLEAANRAKDGFLARVSHEIRTPLTAILGYAELLAARLSAARDLSDIAEIRDNGRYLQRLVDDLLDLSRIIAGKIAIEPGAVDLHQLARELQASMQLRAQRKGLDLSLEVDQDAPSQTFSDPVRIRQILSNLIGNAVKFTQNGGVSIRIHGRPRDDRLFVVFAVRDTGPGIETSQMAALFEPFSQERLAQTPQHDGLGLGLAISQRLADALGGAIEVDSRPGRGSVFSLLLPIIEVPGAALRAAVSTAAPPVPVSTRRRFKGRVLVVDDVGSVVALLHSHLADAGLSVSSAGDGNAALEALAAAQRAGEPFDLVLLDLHMPQLGGRETLERLRAAGHRLPVVALTASPMKGERERCLARGFDAFLSKPFSRDELLRCVGTVLEPAPQPASPPAGVGDDQAGGLVLLVDDHVALAGLTAKQLAALGYRVEAVHDAAAAIDRAAAIHPDAMIIDLSLPDMHGIDLARRLRQDPRLADCRLIAYTGHEEADEHVRARQAGFDAVLLKPAAPQAFHELLSGGG